MAGKAGKGTYCADILVVEEDGVVGLRGGFSISNSGVRDVLAGMMDCDCYQDAMQC